MSLVLRINGEKVNLKPGERIPITLTSPLLNLSDIPSGAFNFNVGLDDQNNRILKFPGRLSKYPFVKEQSTFDLTFKGLEIMEGIAEFDNITPTEAGVSLGTATAGFYARLENTKLADFSYGGPILMGSDLAEAMETIYIGGADMENPVFYCFPVYNRWIYAQLKADDTILQDENLISWSPMNHLDDLFSVRSHRIATQNPFEWVIGAHGVDYRYLTQPNENNPFITTPFLRLTFVLDRLFEELGYNLLDNPFYTHPEFKHVALYSNYDWHNDYVYELGAPTFPGNLYLTPNKFVPDSTVWDFIKSVEVFYNCTFIFDHYNRNTRINFNESIFESPTSPMFDGKISRGFNIKNLNPAKVSLEYKHVESDVFGAGCSMYDTSRFYQYNGFSTPPGIKQNDLAIFTEAYSLPPILKYFPGDNLFPAASLKDESNTTMDKWSYSFRIAKYIANPNSTEEIKFETNASHLVMSNRAMMLVAKETTLVTSPFYFRCPVVAIPMRTNTVFSNGGTPVPLTETDEPNPILFTVYRGLQTGFRAAITDANFNANDMLYIPFPYASSDIRDSMDGYNQFDYSLLLTNENRETGKGLIPQQWKKTWSWLKSGRRMVTYNVELTADEFRNFRFDEIKTHMGVAYLPVELRVDLSEKGFGMAELDVITI